jgi:hypothetical protein
VATSFADNVPVSENPDSAATQVTMRAVMLGLLTIFLTAIYLTYYGRNLVKSYMPVAVLLPFIGWVGINTVLRLLLPQWALSRVEMLTIYGMIWVSGSLPAIGWGLHAVSLIAAPEFYASPENRLREVVLPHLPKWLFLDARRPDVRQVYTGLAPGDAIPWLLWVRPFFWWLFGCFSALMAGFFGSVLFLKQWSEKERLVFPMAEFPIAMLKEGPGSRLPALFRDRIFWFGFACTAGVIGWNILGYFAITLPRITLFDHYLSKSVSLGRYFPNYYLRVQPLIMGLAYLCPLDILLSVWVFNLVNILKIGLLNRTGFTVGLPGQPATGAEITTLEAHGALTVLVLWSVWIARAHLKETFRKAFARDAEPDDGAPVTYRSAWIGLGVSSVGLVGWCTSTGMGIGATIIQLILVFVCYFGIAKYAATTGFTYLTPAGGKGGSIMTALGGTAHLSPSSQAMITLLNRNVFLGAPVRTASMTAMIHFLKMLGNQLRRHPYVWGALPVAFVFGYACSASVYLYHCYDEGGLNGRLVSWGMDALANQVPYIEGSKVTTFDPQKVTVWLFGGAEAALLTYLRSRVSWWPIHPVALAFPPRMYGFCLFLVWLVKLLVLRFGGVTLYRKSVPFWYGVIVGYVTGIGVSGVVDAIYFPHGGHFVHGW